MPRKPQPSKLFSLKEWLTLDDAARHLSIVFGEEVTRADVLRLALDRRLTLSVNFVNHATARKGYLAPVGDTPFKIFPSLKSAADRNRFSFPIKVSQEEAPNLPAEVVEWIDSGELIAVPDGIHYRQGFYLRLNKDVETIRGIWDLPLLGGEALDVEHLYQAETGGPEVTLTNLEGAFVERGDVVCQLQNDYDDNEFCVGSAAHGRLIEDRIAASNMPKEAADERRTKFKAQRQQFRERREASERATWFHPADSLPDDAVYVVRTAALQEFEQSVFDLGREGDKPVSRREETTLLNIVGGLLGLLLGKSPSGAPQSVFKSQSAVIDALLAHHDGKAGISARTLQEKFAAAKRSVES